MIKIGGRKKINIFLMGCLLVMLGLFLSGLWLFENNKTVIIPTENVNLAIYLNEEKTNNIPAKDSGYYFDREKSTCTNEAYINWDSVSWSPVIKNASSYPVRCKLYFTTFSSDYQRLIFDTTNILPRHPPRIILQNSRLILFQICKKSQFPLESIFFLW